MIISFQCFSSLLQLVNCPVEIHIFLSGVLQSCCWSTSSPRAVGLPEQDFVGCFVMTHHMTCQTKTPLSHDVGDPWEEPYVLGWSCNCVMTRLRFSAAFLCRCQPVHFLLQFVLATMNRVHISGSVRPSS